MTKIRSYTNVINDNRIERQFTIVFFKPVLRKKGETTTKIEKTQSSKLSIIKNREHTTVKNSFPLAVPYLFL